MRDLNVKVTMTADTLDHFETCHKAYGRQAQEDILLEEMAELTKAILKHRRAERCGSEVGTVNARDAIIDELADVMIMITQLRAIWEVEDIIDPDWLAERIRDKLERQAIRLERGN